MLLKLLVGAMSDHRAPLTYCNLWHRHMWQSQVENEHYSTVSGLFRLVIFLECFIEITPDFLVMNY